MPPEIEKVAEFSPCRRYRYLLKRIWRPSLQFVAFVGFNPSTADEIYDDPTIRRCVGFARSWGYGGVHMLNLFAWRSTKPEGLFDTLDPVGPDNYLYLGAMRRDPACGAIVCAWGVNGEWLTSGCGRRDLQLLNYLGKPLCLGQTKRGFPRHPLYVAATTKPTPFDKGLLR
jgi:hypothetical protein